jgi:hypothetical protein
MSDEERLVFARDGQLSGRLLRVARSMRPPLGAQARLVATLGAGTGALAANAAAAPATAAPAATSLAGSASGSALAASGVAKWVLLGALVGGAATAGSARIADSVRGPEPEPAVVVAKQVHAIEPRRLDARPPAGSGSVPAVAERRDESRRDTRLVARAPRPSVAISKETEPRSAELSSAGILPPVSTPANRLDAASRAPVSASALRAEIAALDAARAALREGDSQRSLANLDQIAGGRLSHEATLLRVQALARAGDHSRARAVAEAFLSEHPGSPFGARIRAAARLDAKP